MGFNSGFKGLSENFYGNCTMLEKNNG